MKRQRISSNTKWEPIVGYSRAIRAGSMVYISGTTATNEDGEVIGVNNPYLQTRQAIQNIDKAISQVGGNLTHLVRTRIYVTDISHWKEVGRAHGEFFLKIQPATTMVEVNSLIHPDMLVEIEAKAILN